VRIPAAEIEQLVASRMRQWLLDPGGIYQATRFFDPSAQRRLLARAAEIGKIWPELPGGRQRALVTALIERIDVGPTKSRSTPAHHGLARSSMGFRHYCRARRMTKPTSYPCRYGFAAPGGKSGC
jgi:hypothetical protein